MGLSNYEYDILMREYDRRRQDNAALLDDRRREVYDRLPAMADIDSEEATAAMDSFKSRLSGTGHGDDLHGRLLKLKEKRAALLRSAGYPKDYLEPIYDCPDCRDTGYIDGEKCHCLRQAEIDILYGSSHMGDILKEENFSRFDPGYYSREIKDASGISAYDAALDALREAREFTEGQKVGENFLIYGDPGVGKTFLSHCIAHKLLTQGRPVVYVTAFTLTEIFQKRTFERTSEARRDYDELFSCDLLIIDDLGTEFTNSFTQPSFFQCINERILKKRSTLISTNLSLAQIKEQYTERIFSRLVEHYRFIHLFGEDIRMKKKMG